MILESFPVGPLACNCTIMGDEASHEAIVVDPGDEVSRIEQRLREHALKVKQILLTHGHLDHVGGAMQLKKLTGAPIYMNEADIPLLDSMRNQAQWMGVEAPEKTMLDGGLVAGQTVGLDCWPAQVLPTPGHTLGSVCLYFASLNLLVAGDTLFAGSIGRTDLPGGDFRQIINSIQTQLLPLPDETRVLPGHGPETSIGEERGSNPYLQKDWQI